MLTNAPLDGVLTVAKPFGPLAAPDAPTHPGHLGVDLRADPGAPVMAVRCSRQ